MSNEDALKDYNYLITINKQDRDVDSISRLGFWAKDNEESIRKALQAKEPTQLSIDEIVDNIGSIEYEVETPYRTIATCVGDSEAKIIVDDVYRDLRKSWKTIIYLNIAIVIQSLIIIYLCFGVQ